MSAQDLRFLGQTQHGIYVDDCDYIDPEILARLYGMVEDANNTGYQIISGDPDDMDDSDWVDWDIQEQISENIQHNFHHEPVAVPKHRGPFTTDASHVAFQGLVTSLLQQNAIPSGYGMLPEEWDDDYPPYEPIYSGRRGGRTLDISLPDHIWRPRAEVWVQALHSMNEVLALEDTNMI